MSKHQAVFEKDPNGKRLTVSRKFSTSLDSLWQAWTDSKFLDQWWAPKPYRAETREFEFREGGHWLYAMVSPEDERNYCLERFQKIDAQKRIQNDVHFCDEQKNISKDFATMYWAKNFDGNDQSSAVFIEITFDNKKDMEQYLEMGFEEGFTAGLDNLDEVLSKK